MDDTEFKVILMTSVPMTFGLITFIVRALLKSNCTKVQCCCVTCERETTHNVKELEINMPELNVV